MDIPALVERRIGSHAAVREVALVGSRGRGDATALSDWDFQVETRDFQALAAALPDLTKTEQTLSSFWDPLADHACYMFILRGPHKVDLLFDEPWPGAEPYVVTAESLQAIDAHFWDWILWLAAKQLRGKGELVGEELGKMTWFLLGPLGVSTEPLSIRDAVADYLSLRDERELEVGVRVPRELATEVVRALRTHGLA